MPHNGIDPVPVACQMVQAFQTIITRNKRPIDTGVISVTMIHAGEAINVDSREPAWSQGTVRTFTTDVLDLIERRMRRSPRLSARRSTRPASSRFRRNYPPTINHAGETEFARGCSPRWWATRTCTNSSRPWAQRTSASTCRSKPGCYFLIGNGDGAHRDGGHGDGPCMLHNPSYDFNDDLIPLGASVWVRLAEAWLAAPR